MLPSNTKSWRYENESFLQGLLQIKSWRFDNEAFVRGFLEIPRSEDVNTRLQPSNANTESVSTHAKHNSTASSQEREKSVPLRAHFQIHAAISHMRAHELIFLRTGSSVYPKKHRFVQLLTFKSHPWCMKTKLSCDASLEFKSWRAENEALTWTLSLLFT